MSTAATTDTRADVTLDTDTVDVIAILEAEGARHGRAAKAETTWSLGDFGEWVCNYGGYFGGSVEERGGEFVASDTFGLEVGSFPTLDEAQAKLADQLHVMLPSVIRPND